MSSSPPSSSPTTFVQADTNTFRDLVQKLTGLSGDSDQKLPVTLPLKLSSKPFTSGDHTRPRRSLFKLQERRHTMRKLEINLGLTTLQNSPMTRQPHLVDSPVPSPVTPLATELPFFPSSGSVSPLSPSASNDQEIKAIVEKGFYLHPSPRGLDQPPELLSLFPLSSPSQQQTRDS